MASQQALLKYDCHNSSFENYHYFAGPEGEQQSLYILDILEDYKGKIWLGTFYGELYTFDLHTQTFERIQLDESLVSFTKIFSICESRPGEIWLGTNRGLYWLETETLKMKRFLTGDGLPNNVIYSVIYDEEGNIWCSTNKGVSCFDTRGQKFVNYTKKDGLQSNEFNQGAYYEHSDGTIYIGGINGLNIFTPSQILENSFVPPTIITAMDIQYHRISPETNPDILSKQISETDELHLNYKENTFSFEYTALSYSLSERNQYEYCLTKEGEEDEWIIAGNRRYATFTNVSPGIYYFKVKGSNSDGVWNENPGTIKIVITPPFWSEWWFRSLFVLFLLISVYAVFYLRVRTIRAQKLLLEKRVAAKTGQLLKQKEQIEKQNIELISLNEGMKQKNKLLNNQNKQISSQRDNLTLMAEQLKQNNQAKIQFYTTLSHELKTPLTLIIEPIKEMLQKRDSLTKVDIFKKLGVMHKNAARLFVTVNQILDFRKIEINKVEMKVSKFDLVPFVRETASFFNDLAAKGKYNYQLQTRAESIKVWADKSMLEKVIFNLLSNAFKYTPEGGSVIVRIDTKKAEKKTAIISVEDSGEGIPAENIPAIFERFNNARRTQKANLATSGLGLAIAKRYLELHNGTIDVESEPGRGSIFTIELPVTRLHFNADVKFTDEFVSEKEVLTSSINALPSLVDNGVETSEDRKKPLLLLIEQDHDLRNYMKEFLSSKFRVEAVTNQKAGTKMLTEKYPELIICDLPVGDSEVLDFCKQVKNEFNTSHIPCMLILPGDDNDLRIQGLSAGADGFVSKPLDMQLLLLSAINLIEGRKRIRMKFDAPEASLAVSEETDGVDKSFLDEAIAYVEANINNPEFNVVMLCRQLGLSQPQVYRKIKALTQLNITEFIRNIRLKKAAKLLQSDKLKVNEVAYQVGFNDPNYFTKSFTKLYGMTPSDYNSSFL